MNEAQQPGADELTTVWVFNGTGSTFPNAVFSSRDRALTWIRHTGVHGTLTAYPLDESAYDFAVRHGFFTPKRPEHTTAAFMQRFTSAAQDHEHFGDEA